MSGRADTPVAGSGPWVRVRLPDDQVVRAALRARIQERDGSWWYALELTLWGRLETRDGRLAGEPVPVDFLAPATDVRPIEDQRKAYAAVPTRRHPVAVRRAAQRRTPLSRSGPMPWDVGGA
ncbi:hypothetical protein [Streptomyces sp. AgN23]|uniref:hypothetical protein n=1 Tax=Streptomyces sp. AgN23 TaxID=1188315 RepID=UPI001B31A1E9|nr:hypothetical protein [Streptomyces sp. AgN23]QTI87216.1 hypothetical protein AS97_39635 [Streptomyces sp. AgN23]WTB02802.1 hypothetical protein OG546_00060 [Streptomyces antimycoticus]WTB11318.1 hypothetical protein OG546_49060 [Streptomyces antimycoticus]